MVLPFKTWQNVNNIRFLFCVLTLERLPGSLYKFLKGIAGQVSPGMLSLTVGACVETPRMRDGHTMRHKRMYGRLIYSPQPAEMCKFYMLNDRLSRKAFKQASIWQLLWTHYPSANDLLINPMTYWKGIIDTYGLCYAAAAVSLIESVRRHLAEYFKPFLWYNTKYRQYQPRGCNCWLCHLNQLISTVEIGEIEENTVSLRRT